MRKLISFQELMTMQRLVSELSSVANFSTHLFDGVQATLNLIILLVFVSSVYHSSCRQSLLRKAGKLFTAALASFQAIYMLQLSSCPVTSTSFSAQAQCYKHMFSCKRPHTCIVSPASWYTHPVTQFREAFQYIYPSLYIHSRQSLSLQMCNFT